MSPQTATAVRPPDAGPAARSRSTLAPPVAVVLALASGAALYAAFPTPGWWPLAPVGVAGLALAVRGRSWPRAAGLGMLAGLAFLVPLLGWAGAYVGHLPWLALAGAESVFVAVLAGLLPLAWRVPGGRAGTVLAISGLWVAQEAARSRVPFGGFPWGRLAFSQADAPSLGYAALGGAPLVTAVVAACGGCLAVAVAAAIDGPDRAGSRRPRGWRRWRPVAVGVAAGLIVFGAGAAVPRPVSASRYAQVAAVQGDVPVPGLEFNARRRAVLDDHASATVGLAQRVDSGRATAPQVVIWPENSSDIDPLRNADAGAVIQNAVDRIGVPILVGTVLQQPPGHESNASILWGPTGSAHPGPGASYVKRHPAPFAEYVPFRSFFRHFSDKVDLAGWFVPGRAVGVLPVGDVRMGDVICFEVAYDSLVRDTVRAGADLIVVQTNNATFGYTDESVQQLAMSRLRAVESGRAVVHISTVGVSALILPDGRLLQPSRLFTQQVLEARLPLRTGQTVATRLGAAPEGALSLLGLLLIAAAIRRGRRGRNTADPPADGDPGTGGPADNPAGGTWHDRVARIVHQVTEAPTGSAGSAEPELPAGLDHYLDHDTGGST